MAKSSGALAARGVWHARAVRIALPMATARAMWERAERWDLDAGGRFEAREDAIVLWSGSRLACSVPRPVGCLEVRWRWPTHDRATIHRLEWHPSFATPEEMQQAIRLLAGL